MPQISVAESDRGRAKSDESAEAKQVRHSEQDKKGRGACLKWTHAKDVVYQDPPPCDM
jgi:hypothetical protein